MRKPHCLVNLLATVAVISAGLVTLVGLLSALDSAEASVASFLVQIVAVVGAIAVLIGVLNLFAVHLGRMGARRHGWPYSLVVVLSAAGVIALRVLDRLDLWSGDLEGERMSVRVFESVQVSLESALAALLLFFLVYAAYRLMRRRVTIWSVLFSLAVIAVLVTWIPLEDAGTLADVHDWLVRVPAGAGARGILIGVALGTLTVGVRVLMGQDRSYRS
ncbi:MAG TPA: hypothetical protein PKD09_10305 [Aggregatilinea sp.]|uniref:hypothetical protein n=1 Tax=Aggregatilinea sp. TaxID=2806333 RepID=UPI002BB00CD9|nr:hypothetical protein [Aggregatilinea sp.]HML22033.1 hypothetical protein [Aggregatilinea sp.]